MTKQIFFSVCIMTIITANGILAQNLYSTRDYSSSRLFNHYESEVDNCTLYPFVHSSLYDFENDDKKEIRGNGIATLQQKEPSDTVSSEEIFFEAEQSPTFPGGEEKMYDFVIRKLRYPYSAAELGIQENILVGFVVEKDGSISNAKAIIGKNKSLIKEAIRVVSSMPKWQAGRQNGKAVRVYQIITVSFKLK